jgi:hypothetical protein
MEAFDEKLAVSGLVGDFRGLASTPVAAQQRGSVPPAPHTVNPSMFHHVPHKPAGHHARAIHTGGKSRGGP